MTFDIGLTVRRGGDPGGQGGPDSPLFEVGVRISTDPPLFVNKNIGGRLDLTNNHNFLSSNLYFLILP